MSSVFPLFLFGRVSFVRIVPATEVELTVYTQMYRWPSPMAAPPSSSLDVGRRGSFGLRAGWMPDGQRLVPRWNRDPYKTYKMYIFSYGRINSTAPHNRPVIFLCSSTRNTSNLFWYLFVCALRCLSLACQFSVISTAQKDIEEFFSRATRETLLLFRWYRILYIAVVLPVRQYLIIDYRPTTWTPLGVCIDSTYLMYRKEEEERKISTKKKEVLAFGCW